jgi:hypothetical protein
MNTDVYQSKRQADSRTSNLAHARATSQSYNESASLLPEIRELLHKTLYRKELRELSPRGGPDMVSKVGQDSDYDEPRTHALGN